jgi:hypothetical protein
MSCGINLYFDYAVRIVLFGVFTSEFSQLYSLFICGVTGFSKQFLLLFLSIKPWRIGERISDRIYVVP